VDATDMAVGDGEGVIWLALGSSHLISQRLYLIMQFTVHRQTNVLPTFFPSSQHGICLQEFNVE
jgi:hypothetical protein